MSVLKRYVLYGVLSGFVFVLNACDVQSPRQKIPDIELTRLDGGTDHLSDWRGKIVILNVWATWCAPCRAEMPALQALSENLNPASYVVLGLSVDEAAFPVREYLRERGIVFAKHIDVKRRISREVLEINELPQTLIIDSQGYLLERIKGERAWNTREVVTKFPKMGM